mgnify:FL=1
MTHKKSTLTQCPHLNKDEVIFCTVSASGLYIPPPSQFELFCATEQFAECGQFMQAAEMALIHTQDEAKNMDEARRNYYRFLQRWALSIRDQAAQDSQYKQLDDTAYTLDLSLGGMRISSRQQLVDKQKIAFIFDQKFSAPSLTGLGEVVWSQAERHDNMTQSRVNHQAEETLHRFQAGVAFSDHNTRQLVGYHLGQAGIQRLAETNQ